MAEKEYIEAKDLDDFKNDIMDKFLSLCNYNDYNKLTLLRIGETIYESYETYVSKPLADVVEVKHGKWVDKPTGSYGRMQSWCSACGKHSGIGGIESNRHKPYCPNCGAKMDGERKEETT